MLRSVSLTLTGPPNTTTHTHIHIQQAHSTHTLVHTTRTHESTQVDTTEHSTLTHRSYRTSNYTLPCFTYLGTQVLSQSTHSVLDQNTHHFKYDPVVSSLSIIVPKKQKSQTHNKHKHTTNKIHITSNMTQ